MPNARSSMVTSLSLALLLALFAGCSKSSTDSPSGGAAGAAQAHAPAGEEGVRPPLVLTLAQKEGAAGEVEVTATIDATGPVAFPVQIKVTPPRDAKLVSGSAEETLTVSQAGKLTRTFKVQTSRPLSADDPLKVVVHGQSAAGGLHAEKQLPPRAEAAPPSPKAPPGGRPPSPVPTG